MVTLTSDNLTHLMQQLFVLCLVCGFIGALFWDFMKGVLVWGVVAFGDALDRKARIKRSRERASNLRSFGERAVRVANRMDARQDAKDAAKRPAPVAVAAPPLGLYCPENGLYHAWDGDVCITCGAHAPSESLQ